VRCSGAGRDFENSNLTSPMEVEKFPEHGNVDGSSHKNIQKRRKNKRNRCPRNFLKGPDFISEKNLRKIKLLGTISDTMLESSAKS